MDGVPEHDPLNIENSVTPEDWEGAGARFTPSEASQLWPDPEPAPHHDGPVYLPPVPLEPAPRPTRIPNFAHLILFALLLGVGAACAGAVTAFALHQHWFGIQTVQAAKTDVHYTLGSEAILYLITFVACLLIFPLVWRRGFFEGLQWNGLAAMRRHRTLLSAAVICFIMALLSEFLMPGPTNAPIDRLFRSPGAAWLLFAFGVTFAPFFEEMIFRGFLLPAICTSCDWIEEKIRHEEPPPLYADGHPQWSFPAMVFGAVATSIPFALLHAPQTGNSLGPFVLLTVVSLVLCWARLSTRSLAASVFVHATYNFMIFTLTLIGTEGFRHMHRM